MNTITALSTLPLIGILRGFKVEQLPKIIEAVTEGGLRNVEVTMNSPGAVSQIQIIRKQGRGLSVGAGTVTSLDLLEEALAAGATFIVTPALNASVVEECVRRKIPVLAGALSPTEIAEAWELGATMVKIFPGDCAGPAFVRAMRGPFPEIKLLPTGGVDLRTGGEFLRAGAAGLGVGSPLFDKNRIDAEDWTWLRDQTRRFVALFS